MEDYEKAFEILRNAEWKGVALKVERADEPKDNFKSNRNNDVKEPPTKVRFSTFHPDFEGKNAGCRSTIGEHGVHRAVGDEERDVRGQPAQSCQTNASCEYRCGLSRECSPTHRTLATTRRLSVCYPIG